MTTISETRLPTSEPALMPLQTSLRSTIAGGRKILTLFVTAGLPAQQHTVDVIEAAADAGADMIELGVPFSDPVADGVVIQQTSSLALQHGMNVGIALDIARQAARRVRIPIVLMGYINPVLAFGLPAFIRRSADAGVMGLIFPDLPPEEGAEYLQLARNEGIASIFLASPTTPAERLRTLDDLSTGFLYLVSVAGVTGARAGLAESSIAFARTARKIVNRNPMLVGFGISTPADARRMAQESDGVIVGSALLSMLLNSPDPPWKDAVRFIASLRTSLDTTEES